MSDLEEWLTERDGIAHRESILAAGFTVATVRGFVASERGHRIRRWVALPSADPSLREAARLGGRVSCVSLARRRGWWMPSATDGALHLHRPPGSGAVPAGGSAAAGPVVHWTVPIEPCGRVLVAPVLDALAHIAVCQPRETAIVLWESAVTIERMPVEILRAVRWPSVAARDLAASVHGLSDSGLETLLVEPLRAWGIPLQQQAYIAGRFVDLLIGDRLVVQVDGYEFHAAGSAQRSRDIAHDAELRLRGYTVLRFSYAQIRHDRALVDRAIRLAVAQGLHRA